MAFGMLGRKLGMTQFNTDEGARLAITLVEVGPCLVMQKKTVEKDGYSAVQVGFGQKKAKQTAKAQQKIFEKLKSDLKRYVCEFRVSTEDLASYEEGKEVTLDKVFKSGQYVDITGRTKGRGFTGVVKRWGMKGNSRTHGSHEAFRHGGSIGNSAWPGWVEKGKKMAGHYGDEQVTTKNLKIVKLLPDKNCMAVAGSVPGANNELIRVTLSACQNEA